MKNTTTCLLIAGLILVLAGLSHAATNLNEIGRSPFHQPPLTSVEEMQAMFKEKQKDIQKAFIMAGEPELFEAFFVHAPQADVKTVQFQKGSRFAWMAFKANKGNGPVRIAKDVTWVNEQPFPGYTFSIDKDDTRYTFAVPLGCGNLSLVDKSTVPITATPANQSPKCEMEVTPITGYCGEQLTIDASRSTDPDGDVTKMSVSFVDEKGQVVSEQVIEGSELITQTTLPCGTSTLTVTVTDNDNMSATSPECKVAVTGNSRVRILADLGYYRQFDPGDYLFGRVGLEYKINQDFSVLGFIGGAPHIKGSDGASAFMIDLLGEYTFSRYFINLGVGGWISDGDNDIDAEDTQLDVIAAVGARIYGKPDKFNTSIFVEARSGVDEMDEMAKYGRFGVGLRCRF